jgi:hypothetical protein
MKYSWEGTSCEEPSWEGDPERLCILHSLVPEKDKKAFDQAVKDKLAREDNHGEIPASDAGLSDRLRRGF